MRILVIDDERPIRNSMKEILSDEEFVIIDAEEEPELTAEFGVMQAPALVVVDGDKREKFVNASNIQKYVSTQH